jgi:threonine dehydrogenase-like Zn-dependent dehydrogenase
MRAVVDNGPYDLALEDVDDPKIEAPNEAVIPITSACPAVQDHFPSSSARVGGGSL